MPYLGLFLVFSIQLAENVQWARVERRNTGIKGDRSANVPQSLLNPNFLNGPLPASFGSFHVILTH